MKRKRLKKPIRILLVVLVITVIAAIAAVLLRKPVKEVPVEEPEETVEEVIAEPEEEIEEVIEEIEPEPYELSEEELAELRQELREDQEINPDVTSILHFKSGLIHDPVLQYYDENYYLYKDWQTKEYLSYGSIVLDSRNQLNLDDMNTIIYGHYIYEFRNPDRTLVFTPLSQLLEEDAYEENKYLALLRKDEIRYYEIASVYNCPLDTIGEYQYARYGLEYNLLEYDEEYFDLYHQNIKQNEYYSTDVEFGPDDHYLTLQTCIENHNEAREIVLCKEIARIPLEEE